MKRYIAIACWILASLPPRATKASCSQDLRSVVQGFVSVDGNVEADACAAVLEVLRSLPEELRRMLVLLNVVRLSEIPIAHSGELLDDLWLASKRYWYHPTSHTLVISNSGSRGPGWRYGKVSESKATHLAMQLGLLGDTGSTSWCMLSKMMRPNTPCLPPGDARVLDDLVRKGAQSSLRQELLEHVAVMLATRRKADAGELWARRAREGSVRSDRARFLARIRGDPWLSDEFDEYGGRLLSDAISNTSSIGRLDLRNVIARALLGLPLTSVTTKEVVRIFTEVLERAGLDALWVLRQFPEALRASAEFLPHYGDPIFSVAVPSDSIENALGLEIGGQVLRPHPDVVAGELLERAGELLSMSKEESIEARIKRCVSFPGAAAVRLRRFESELGNIDAKAATGEPSVGILEALLFGWSSLGHVERTRYYGNKLLKAPLGNERRLRALLAGAQRLLEDARYTDAEQEANLSDDWMLKGGAVSTNLRVRWALFWAHLGRYDRSLRALAKLGVQGDLARLEVARLLSADGMRETASSQLDAILLTADWSSYPLDALKSGIQAYAALERCEDVDRIIAQRPYREQGALWAEGTISGRCAPRSKFTGAQFSWLQAERAVRRWSEGDREGAIRDCEAVYPQRQRVYESWFWGRSLYLCGVLWVLAREDEKALDAHAMLQPYMSDGDEVVALMSKRALRDAQYTDARKLAWKVRCHPCREALLKEINIVAGEALLDRK